MGAQRACHCAAGGQDVTPSVVGVGNDLCATTIGDAYYVTERIGDIIVVCTIVIDRQRLAVNAIGEDQGIAANGHLGERRTIVGINIGSATITALCAESVGIVGEFPSGVILTIPRKL